MQDRIEEQGNEKEGKERRLKKLCSVEIDKALAGLSVRSGVLAVWVKIPVRA
jgi:hypothetical protein